MKKGLSLLLALTMVLTMVPYVFAEGEQVLTYDLAEAFYVKDFTDATAVAYPESLTAQNANDGSGTWTIGYYTFNAADDTKTTFTKFTKLARLKGTRAFEDVINTGKAYGLTYTTRESGTETGVGSYTNGVNCATGSVGYNFKSGSTTTYTSGVGNNGDKNQQAIVFTAPYDGVIQPKLIAFARSGAADVAYRLDKIDANGVCTAVYPLATDETVALSWDMVPQEWKSGWGTLPLYSAGVLTADDALVRVSAGDQLVLRFAALVKGKEFGIDTYTMTYVTESSKDITYEYDTTARTVDLRSVATEGLLLSELPETAVFEVPQNSGLTETTKGVFSIANDFTDGTPVVVTVTYGGMTLTINLTLTLKKTEYNLAEAFYVKDFTDATAAAYPESLTAKNANDGSGTWTIGYYTFNAADDTKTTFTKFTKLTRLKTTRAFEDAINTGKAYGLTYTTRESGTESGVGAYANGVNCATGSVGYNFESDSTTLYTSGVGNNGDKNQQAIVFVAPRDGVIQPMLKAVAKTAETVAYRLDKIDATGNRSTIYPLANDETVTLSWDVVPTEWKSRWGKLTSGELWTASNGLVTVKAGDKLVLRFAALTKGSEFGIDSYILKYREDFGSDDEALLVSPMQDYEASYTYIKDQDLTVDLTRPLLNDEAKGTVKYIVSGNADVLRETATPGIYTLTGVLNMGGDAAVVTAEYWSSNPAETEALFTTDTEVYVNALSAGSATFIKETFKATQLGLAYDGYQLPYYTDAAERAVYGAVDLGLTDAWKNATVTFDKPGYFEYLGNGRIRATALYNYVQAGGSAGRAASASYTTPNNTVVTAKRDANTVGTPVIMTVTAPDGGSRSFSLWSFNAKARDFETNGTNSYSFLVAEPFANEVMKLEAYKADGTFAEMYPESYHADPLLTPLADDMYADRDRAPYITASKIVFVDPGSTYWGNYVSNTEYMDYDGISFSFTALRDGTINLTDYIANSGTVSGSQAMVTTLMSKPFSTYVRLYNADGTSYETLYGCTYAADPAAANMNPFLSIVSESVGTNAVKDTDTGALTFAVKKGQVVRVILASSASSGANNISIPRTVLPIPTFTYVFDGTSEGDEAFTAEYGGGTAYGFVYVPGGSEMPEAGTLVVAYDVNGNVVGTATVATNDSMIVDMDGTYGLVDVEMPTTAIPTYMKFFMWKDLENIQPLYGDITIH